jgi:hypothetical protein
MEPDYVDDYPGTRLILDLRLAGFCGFVNVEKMSDDPRN